MHKIQDLRFPLISICACCQSMAHTYVYICHSRQRESDLTFTKQSGPCNIVICRSFQAHSIAPMDVQRWWFMFAVKDGSFIQVRAGKRSMRWKNVFFQLALSQIYTPKTRQECATLPLTMRVLIFIAVRAFRQGGRICRRVCAIHARKPDHASKDVYVTADRRPVAAVCCTPGQKHTL